MSGFDVHVIDAILALMALEGLGLVGWRALKGSGPKLAPFMGTLVAGGALLVAFREALSGASAAAIGAALAVSLVAHIVDIAGRWTARETAVAAETRIGRVTISLRAQKRQRPRGNGAEA